MVEWLWRMNWWKCGRIQSWPIRQKRVNNWRYHTTRNLLILSGGYDGQDRETRNAYKTFVEKSLWTRPLWRTRWEANVKMGLREEGCDDWWWMELAQGRVPWRNFVFAVLSLGVLLPVRVRSAAQTVAERGKRRVMSSNSLQPMDVYSSFVCCLV
jgi:hypothetical protein